MATKNDLLVERIRKVVREELEKQTDQAPSPHPTPASPVAQLTEKQLLLFCCIAEHLLRTVPIRSGCPEIERLKLAVKAVRDEKAAEKKS